MQLDMGLKLKYFALKRQVTQIECQHKSFLSFHREHSSPKKYTPSLLERDPRTFHGIVGNIRLDIPTHDLCDVSFRLFRMLLNDAEFTQIKVMIERKLEKFLELSQLNNWYSEHDTERFPLQKTLIIHKIFRAPRGFLFFRVSFYSRFRVMHARARTRTQELNALPLTNDCIFSITKKS